MKNLVVSIFALSLAAANLNAHCGSCSQDEQHDGSHAHAGAQDMECQKGLMTHYFKVQEALASDDLAMAKSAVSGLKDHVASSPCSVESAECCAASSKAADSIANAKTLAEARSAFEGFSEAMIAQVEAHGAPGKTYKMYCPMADAAWLQDSEKLANPYYGASMLRCGTVQKEYAQ